jgi:hypothetical protein
VVVVVLDSRLVVLVVLVVEQMELVAAQAVLRESQILAAAVGAAANRAEDFQAEQVAQV